MGVVAIAAGCSSGPTAVDEAEAAIAALVAERVPVEESSVTASCPDDATFLAGTELACDVLVGDDDPVEVLFAFGPEAGAPAELRRAVIPTEAAEEHLAGQIQVSAEGPVEVDCGDQTLLVREVGGTFRCQVVRSSDGAVFDVSVTVLGLDGTVRHRVEPTTTTTTTLPPGTTPTTAPTTTTEP